MARTFAENHPEYAINVTSLEGVQPKELDASEIEVRIGATWISTKYIEDFMRETFETPEYLFDRKAMGVQYSNVTGQWNVKGKKCGQGKCACQHDLWHKPGKCLQDFGRFPEPS